MNYGGIEYEELNKILIKNYLRLKQVRLLRITIRTYINIINIEDISYLRLN